MPRVYISIGSNVDRENSIRGAVRELTARYGQLILSRVYESRAVGFAGGNFYNLVAGFDTGENPERVKEALGEIETCGGRRRDGPHLGSRTLDLDLLLYGDTVRHDGRIDLPHPDIRRYAFVLRPLAEIAPQGRHPETGLVYKKMWEQFGRDGQELTPVDFEFQ
jgi:2-amino-4-hydroxy-6-hydroxymethyldihydropteridine diphosphokinase